MGRQPGQRGNRPVRFRGSSSAHRRGAVAGPRLRGGRRARQGPSAHQGRAGAGGGGARIHGASGKETGAEEKEGEEEAARRGGQRIRPAPVRAGLSRLGRWKETAAAEDAACIRAGGTLRTGSRRALGAGFCKTPPRAATAVSYRRARPGPAAARSRLQAEIPSCLSVSPGAARGRRRGREASGVGFQPEELVLRPGGRGAAEGRAGPGGLLAAGRPPRGPSWATLPRAPAQWLALRRPRRPPGALPQPPGAASCRETCPAARKRAGPARAIPSKLWGGEGCGAVPLREPVVGSLWLNWSCVEKGAWLFPVTLRQRVLGFPTISLQTPIEPRASPVLFLHCVYKYINTAFDQPW